MNSAFRWMEKRPRLPPAHPALQSGSYLIEMSAFPSASTPVRPLRLAILGGGPAGAIFAALMAEKGAAAAIFHDGKRPELIVGESLVPGIIPTLQKLGIEDEVRAFSQLKPGATFRATDEDEIVFRFTSVEGLLPTYAYNVPRLEFDALLLERARRGGVAVIDQPAAVLRGPGGAGPEVVLAPESLALLPASWGGQPPDLIVDATGRRRLLAGLLDIGAEIGTRKDVAHFAHYEGFNRETPDGQIIITRHAAGGWSWQIPLRDRVSVGIVMNRETARQFGTTPEERLEAAIDAEPLLRERGRHRRRLTAAATYTNYQLISRCGHGPGWVMAGDAFGFVDPMLSPGLYIATRSAEELAALLPASGPLASTAPLARYEKTMRHQLRAWQELIAHFYSGRIHSLYKGSSAHHPHANTSIYKAIDRHISRNVAAMCCGAYTARPYSRRMIGLATRLACRQRDPAPYAIA